MPGITPLPSPPPTPLNPIPNPRSVAEHWFNLALLSHPSTTRPPLPSTSSLTSAFSTLESTHNDFLRHLTQHPTPLSFQDYRDRVRIATESLLTSLSSLPVPTPPTLTPTPQTAFTLSSLESELSLLSAPPPPSPSNPLSIPPLTYSSTGFISTRHPFTPNLPSHSTYPTLRFYIPPISFSLGSHNDNSLILGPYLFDLHPTRITLPMIGLTTSNGSPPFTISHIGPPLLPSPNRGNSIHPHIRETNLCWGLAANTLYHALITAPSPLLFYQTLLSYFLTYNPGSPLSRPEYFLHPLSPLSPTPPSPLSFSPLLSPDPSHATPPTPTTSQPSPPESPLPSRPLTLHPYPDIPPISDLRGHQILLRAHYRTTRSHPLYLPGATPPHNGTTLHTLHGLLTTRQRKLESPLTTTRAQVGRRIQDLLTLDPTLDPLTHLNLGTPRVVPFSDPIIYELAHTTYISRSPTPLPHTSLLPELVLGPDTTTLYFIPEVPIPSPLPTHPHPQGALDEPTQALQTRQPAPLQVPQPTPPPRPRRQTFTVRIPDPFSVHPRNPPTPRRPNITELPPTF